MLTNDLNATNNTYGPSIFDEITNIHPRSFMKIEPPDVLMIKSLTEAAHNLFLPIGPTMCITYLSFSLKSKTGRSYSISVPLNPEDSEIIDVARAIKDKANAITDKICNFSTVNYWNLLPCKNVELLKSYYDGAEGENYDKRLEEANLTASIGGDGYMYCRTPASDIPAGLCVAKTMILPYSVINRLKELNVTSLSSENPPLCLIYQKNAVGGFYTADVNPTKYTVPEKLKSKIIVRDFAQYDEFLHSTTFKEKALKILKSIDAGHSPVPMGKSAAPASKPKAVDNEYSVQESTVEEETNFI